MNTINTSADLQKIIKKPYIRPIAIAIIRRNDHILVFEGIDRATGEIFHRPLGGGIDFGEKAYDTIHREFVEELGLELQNVQLKGVIESIFNWDAKDKHEITFVFEGEFKDASQYQHDRFRIHEPYFTKPNYAIWRSIEDFKTGKTVVYPREIVKWL